MEREGIITTTLSIPLCRVWVTARNDREKWHGLIKILWSLSAPHHRRHPQESAVLLSLTPLTFQHHSWDRTINSYRSSQRHALSVCSDMLEDRLYTVQDCTRLIIVNQCRPRSFSIPAQQTTLNDFFLISCNWWERASLVVVIDESNIYYYHASSCI